MTKPQANYVDGFLVVVSKKNIKAYKKMALVGKKLWLKYGAVDYKECMGDKMENGFGISFLKIAGAKKGETVFFSYITYKSKKHRDQVNKRVMNDPMMKDPGAWGKMPFDPKRMAYGGFKVLVG